MPTAWYSFFIIDRPIDTLRYSAFRTRGRVVLRARGGGQHVCDEFRRACAGEHSGPRIFMAEPRRTPGTYIYLGDGVSSVIEPPTAYKFQF